MLRARVKPSPFICPAIIPPTPRSRPAAEKEPFQCTAERLFLRECSGGSSGREVGESSSQAGI